MTSGYKAVGDTATSGYIYGSGRTPFNPNTTSLFDPGKNYTYWDSAMNQFANVITRIANQPLDELFKIESQTPLEWMRTPGIGLTLGRLMG